VLIRVEEPADVGAVRSVNDLAFGHAEESDLIENLHAEGAVMLSLVACLDARVVGHILFSRMWIDTADGLIPAVALAPMAVLPDHQRRGVGHRLIRHGLYHLRDAGEQIVMVLGHREYYPRFGFSTEKARRIESPFPADAYMALELSAGALEGVRGRVKYPKAFGL
jgi:putative acetyltransferase